MLGTNQLLIHQKYSTRDPGSRDRHFMYGFKAIALLYHNLGFCKHYFIFIVPEAFILHNGLILFAKPLQLQRALVCFPVQVPVCLF